MRLEISICIVECGLSHHLLEWIFLYSWLVRNSYIALLFIFVHAQINLFHCNALQTHAAYPHKRHEIHTVVKLTERVLCKHSLMFALKMPSMSR